MALTQVQGGMISSLPTGSVIQVVQQTYNSSTSTTSTTLVDTGSTVNITPKFATSKILVIYTTCTRRGLSDTTNGISFSLLRNGSVIFSPGTYIAYQYPTSAYVQEGFSANYLDSPATTSTLTYKYQFLSITGGSVQVNHDSCASTLTLMEISA